MLKKPTTVESGGGRETNRFGDLLAARMKYRFDTLTDLAQAAGVPLASISMVKSGKRDLSQRTAIKVAKALLPPSSPDWRRLAQELLSIGKKSPASNAAPSKPRRRTVRNDRTLEDRDLLANFSGIERVRFNGRIHTGMIPTPPFVFEDLKTGFAVEFYDHLTRIMDIVSLPKDTRFSQMAEAIRQNSVDIIVTGLVPTYHRSGFLDFSPPLPYLRIPLSGIVRKRPRNNLDLALDDFIRPDDNQRKPMSELRLLLIRGEAGEEFVGSFFDRDLSRILATNQRISKEVDLSPSQLAQRLVEAEGFDLMIADLGTCKATMDALDAQFEPSKNPFRTLPDNSKILPTLSIPVPNTKEVREYFQFATYPVVFAFKKGDRLFEAMISDAFKYLLTEGIRAVIALYQRYWQDYDDFKFYFDPDNDEGVSSLTKTYFENSNLCKQLRIQRMQKRK